MAILSSESGLLTAVLLALISLMNAGATDALRSRVALSGGNGEVGGLKAIANSTIGTNVTRILADLLIPGRGAPVYEGVVIVQGSTITYAGPKAGAPAPSSSDEDVFSVPVVMPGLWNSHTHYNGEGTPGSKLVGGYYPEKYIEFASAVRQLKESLNAGITSVRDLGGPFSQALSWLITRGDIDGPHFHYAGRFIGMTGGHTDLHTLPLGVVTSSDWEGSGTLCDGVPECLKRTREQLRQQADVIKVMTSGGVLSQYDQVTDNELSMEEVRAIVNEAARARRVVAAHAHSHGGIQTAIDAGVHSIEHGSYMDATQAGEIKAKGMVYVPTCAITQVFNASDDKKPSEWSELSWGKGKAVLPIHRNAVRAAVEAGVTILTGTDCPHGCSEVGSEIVYLTQLYGMSTLAAIEAATANGPMSLGGLGLAPTTGQVREGYDADIIALAASPLEDVSVLSSAEKITHVWKAGKLFKQPQHEQRCTT